MSSIFISYSREDSDQLQTISEDCEAMGHTVWIDKELKGGQNWWDQILSRIRESDIILFILSDASVNSEACKREFSYAGALGKAIIPIQVSAKISINLLPEEIAGLQILDYRTNDKASAFELVKALNNVEIKPLPDSLPKAPALPISYMGQIAKQLGAETLTIQQQSHIFLEIKQFTRKSNTTNDVEALIEKLSNRFDLFASIAIEINDLKLKLEANKEVDSKKEINLYENNQQTDSESNNIPPYSSEDSFDKNYNKGLELVKQKDYTEAVKYFRKGADNNHSGCQYELAYMYEFGYGVRKDSMVSMSLYNISAKQNFPLAQLELGLIYSYSRNNVQSSSKKAYYWLKKAADSGFPDACYRFWQMGLRGIFPSDRQNHLLELSYLKKAAELKHKKALVEEAKFMLGEEGSEYYGVPFNIEKGLKIINTLANNNDSYAQQCLAEIYEFGDVVTKDIKLATYWYKKAAEQGEVYSQGWLENKDFEISDKIDETNTHSIGSLKMVEIPSGTFQMGSHECDTEKPIHLVNIKKFAMGQTAVTFSQWDVCYSEGGTNHWPDDYGNGRGNRPVIDVNWDDVKEYIKWLNEKTGKHYRLPSEAEWEYAARAGSSTKYSWGNSVGKNKANCDGCGSQWDNMKTAPVKSFPKNNFGLYEMHGNVAEWVEDYWHDDYSGAPSDGRAWTSGGDEFDTRVRRGGDFDVEAPYLCSNFRDGDSSIVRDGCTGFRLAHDI